MRSCFPILLALGAAALLAGAPLAAQPALTGPEIFVDTWSEAGNEGTFQHLSAAAADANGRTMLAWVDRLGSVTEIRGRAFDASGRPVRPSSTLATEVQPQEAPALTATSGGFLLAWQASEPLGNMERRRILGRRLSPSGLPRGGVIQIRDRVTVPRYFFVGSLQAASAPDGSFVAVWSEINAGTNREDVFFRRFDAAGKPLAKAARLPQEGGTEQRSAPSVAVLSGGEIRIAWTSRSAAGAPESLWVRRFDRNGVPLAAPVRLLPDSADASGTSVTFGPDGGWLAGWVLRSEPDVLHLRAFAPNGAPWPEHQTPRPQSYQVTAERGGTFLVSWPALLGSPCTPGGLQLEADGAPRGPLGCLTGPPFGIRVADIAVTGREDGGFALFWAPGQRLFGQRLAGAGRPGTLQIERARSAVLESAAEPLALHVVRRDGTAGTVSVDYELTGAVAGSGTVTFPDGDSTPRTISIPVSDDSIPGNDRAVHVTLSLPTGGAVLGLPQRAAVEIRDDDEPSPLLAHAEPLLRVAESDGNTWAYDPSLALSSSGDLEVVWAYAWFHPVTDPVPLTYSVQGRRFDAAGRPGTFFDHRRSGRSVGRVRAAMHPAGDFMVFWQEGDDGYLKRFDVHGAVAGPTVHLKFLPDGAAPLPEGRFVAVGRGHDSAGEGLFVHFLTPNGLDQRSPALATRGVLQPGSPSVVATDLIGRSVVVWSVATTGAGPDGIFARRFNNLGEPLGPPFRVSQEEEGHELLPGVATDGQGNFVVAWQRTGPGSGVYARAFNAAGAPLSDEILVNSELIELQTATPSVALTGDGRFAVLWQTPVSGQLLTSTGKRLGSEALFMDPGAVDPIIAWSDRGYFVSAVSLSWIGAVSTRRLPL